MSARRRAWILGPVLCGISCILLAAVLWLQRTPNESLILIWRTQELTGIRHEIGYAYVARTGRPGLSSHEHPSVARILADEKFLAGPADSLHDDIRKIGGGRYSFWHENVYFSTLDNSSPITNGRHYEISYPGLVVARTSSIGVLASVSGLLILGVLFTVNRTTGSLRALPRFLCVLLPMILMLIQIAVVLPARVYDRVRTWWYIETFRPQDYEARGADYCGPMHVDTAGRSQYDYAKVSAAAGRVRGVIRSAALQGIFRKVTAGADTNTAKHLRVLAFLHKATYHPPVPPTYPNGELVYDPLVLLELGDMWCGQGAKLAIDMFQAVGYEGRMVQLGNHQIAEILYDDKWHYFDTDLFGNGEMVFDSDGTVPSFEELVAGHRSRQLDALSAYREWSVDDCRDPAPNSDPYPSFFYVSRRAYEEDAPLGYYYKNATLREADADARQYGWLQGTWSLLDKVLSDQPRRYPPDIPYLDTLVADRTQRTLRLSFHAKDADGDLAGYKVFVSGHSRGWHYNQFYGNPALEPYWADSGGWKPSMYDSLFTVPPADVAVSNLKSTEGETTLSFQKAGTYFITIMPFDVYGESVGRTLYPESNELMVRMP